MTTWQYAIMRAIAALAEDDPEAALVVLKSCGWVCEEEAEEE